MCGDRSELDIVRQAREARRWTDEDGEGGDTDDEDDEADAEFERIEWWRARFVGERFWQQRWVARCCAIAMGEKQAPTPGTPDTDLVYIRSCLLVGQAPLRYLPDAEEALWRYVDRSYRELTVIRVPSLAQKLAMRDAELRLRRGQLGFAAPPTPSAPRTGATRSCCRSGFQRFRPL